MLPAKCVHVTLPGAWKVAKHLKIDYADACVREGETKNTIKGGTF
jgi:hypothetical protein